MTNDEAVKALEAAIDHWWNYNEEDDRPREHHATVIDISPAMVAKSMMPTFLAALAANGLVIAPAETVRVGEAVERLGDSFAVTAAPQRHPDNAIRCVIDRPGGGWVEGYGPDVASAIDAALRGPQA